jgi:hypothetical protein
MKLIAYIHPGLKLRKCGALPPSHYTPSKDKNSCNFMRFEVLMAVIIKSTIFWDVMWHSLVEVY